MRVDQEFLAFARSRFGGNLLKATLLSFAAGSLLFSWYAFDRAQDRVHRINQIEANGRAIQEALGFGCTAIVEPTAERYPERVGTEILRVEPGRPFDKAGLKRRDHVPLGPRTIRARLLRQRGKTAVLPVERAGRRFSVTVGVPRFTLPHPEIAP